MRGQRVAPQYPVDNVTRLRCFNTRGVRKRHLNQRGRFHNLLRRHPMLPTVMFTALVALAAPLAKVPLHFYGEAL